MGVTSFNPIEAKQVIDGYLQKHPDSPFSVLFSQCHTGRANFVEAAASSMSSAVVLPERCQPLPPENLPRRVGLPQVYLVARTDSETDDWICIALKACFEVVADSSSVQIVDQEPGIKAGVLARAVVKLSEPLSKSGLDRLSDRLRQNLPAQVGLRLLPGPARSEISIPREELRVDYFRNEFAVDSSMVHHGTSCVKLTHIPTQISARSTAHRSRAVNYEEALCLLASEIKCRA